MKTKRIATLSANTIIGLTESDMKRMMTDDIASYFKETERLGISRETAAKALCRSANNLAWNLGTSPSPLGG